MKQKFFAIGTIALMAVVSLFIFQHVTSAQRPDRNAQQGQNQRGGNRGGMDMMRMFNPNVYCRQFVVGFDIQSESR